MNERFDSFQQVYDERFAAKYGYWRPVVERLVAAFVKCGALYRVRCRKCKHEPFVGYSCEHRCTCPLPSLLLSLLPRACSRKRKCLSYFVKDKEMRFARHTGWTSKAA